LHGRTNNDGTIAIPRRLVRAVDLATVEALGDNRHVRAWVCCVARPVSYLIVRCDGHTNQAVILSYSVAYYPLHQLGWYSPPINSCYQVQWRWMNDTFGDVEYKLNFQR